MEIDELDVIVTSKLSWYLATPYGLTNGKWVKLDSPVRINIPRINGIAVGNKLNQRLFELRNEWTTRFTPKNKTKSYNDKVNKKTEILKKVRNKRNLNKSDLNFIKHQMRFKNAFVRKIRRFRPDLIQTRPDAIQSHAVEDKQERSSKSMDSEATP
jgi:hypothetical protein